MARKRITFDSVKGRELTLNASRSGIFPIKKQKVKDARVC